jgi:hypothetical protein
VIHGFIVVSAKDPSEVAAADSRFAEIFLASAVPRDPDAFPACTVVIQQSEKLERHHEEAGLGKGTQAAKPGF